MHFGTGPDEMETISELDPYVIDDHLQEIEICNQVSKSIFFIVSATYKWKFTFKSKHFDFLFISIHQALIGDSVGKTKIPTKLDLDVFNALLEHASSEHRTILKDWYTSNTKTNDYTLRQDYR